MPSEYSSTDQRQMANPARGKQKQSLQWRSNLCVSILLVICMTRQSPHVRATSSDSIPNGNAAVLAFNHSNTNKRDGVHSFQQRRANVRIHMDDSVSDNNNNSTISSTKGSRRLQQAGGTIINASTKSARRNTTFTTIGNCVAGGSGYGVAFDYTRADTISLHWRDIPAARHTVEYWYKNTDLHLAQQQILAYSAYNVRGYQDQGGLPYEAANELLFMMSSEFLTLWRGSGRLDLNRKVNPRIDNVWSDQWHHYAYTYNSESDPTPLVQFFLDGQQLDMGSVLITVDNHEGEVKNYEKAPFSNDWDVAESPDAVPYYGSTETTIYFAENPCQDFPLEEESTTQQPITVWITMQQQTLAQCTLREQAKNAASAGAYAVVFEKNETIPSLWVEEEETTIIENNNSKNKLSIPVIAVVNVFENKQGIVTTMNWTRSRDPLQVPHSFATLIEPAGVLALGQEPDKPWGDFDPMQAANGCLDEFRVWTTVRTPEEIANNYKLAITDTTNPELHLYWNFNQPPQGEYATTEDLSMDGMHPGLVGNLPTIANEMTFAIGLPRRPPTAPLRIPTQACPLVGQGQEVVIPVTVGGRTVFELKSFDPDGDNLLTTIVTIPDRGSLFSYETNNGDDAALNVGDVIVDSNRTENKRVIFVAPEKFSNEVTFTYQVQDDATTTSTALPSIGTVRLIPHIVEGPISQNVTIQEDTLSFFSLGRPSQVTQGNMKVVITRIPVRGKLYQAQFDPDTNPSYTSLAQVVDQFGPMEQIAKVGTVVTNYRGIVMYLPTENEASATMDGVYAEFRYRFVDQPSGLASKTEATLGIIVQAVNDPPESSAQSGKVPADAQSTTINLASTDVDADSAENFATRPYARITKFPVVGKLYQYDESSSSGNAGRYVDSSITAVPQTFAWASKVVRFSSQFSQCGNQCFAWRDPLCPSNDLLSGGTESGSCSATAWHASNILGEPDVYPRYADATTGWDVSEENAGHEFIELEFPFPVYMTAFELYETYKPGSVWKISTADEYLDDPEETCVRESCSMKTKWQTLWTKPQETVVLGPEYSTVFAPPLCPGTVKSNLVRLDLDTARAPGWQNFDAAKVTGSLDAPPGLVEDPANRLVYVPLIGVHGDDRLSFASSDCLGEGEEAIYTIDIEPPSTNADGSVGTNDTLFYQQDINLAQQPGQTETLDLDLSPVLQNIEVALMRQPQNMTGSIVFSSALGSNNETFVNISLDNPIVTIELGVEHRGAPFSYMDLWLEDSHLNLTVTFRVRYWIFLQLTCVNGIEDREMGICICSTASWTGEDCSEEVSNNVTLGIFIALPIALVFVVIGLLLCLSYEKRRKKNDPVWTVQKDELKFMDPPVVVGRGTFGVVLLAEYRGTQVAVKHVIRPRFARTADEHLDENDPNTGSDHSFSFSESRRRLSAHSSTRSLRESFRRLNTEMNSSTHSLEAKRRLSVGKQSVPSVIETEPVINGSVSTWGGKKSENSHWRKKRKEFVEEMRYLSKLRHPCVTTIMGVVLGQDPMLVMEYMEHGSLYDILHNETVVIEGELLLPILRDISQGVRFLHSASPQVIHGDLKSQNVLVDTKFRAKVADFGLSQKKNIAGTAASFWMAPELLRKESDNNAATDVYSFGIILYEVYSRRDPYEDEEPQKVLREIADKFVKKRPPFPRNMPEKVKLLMSDCVDFDPENRPTFEEVDLRIKRMDERNIAPGQATPRASSVSLFDIFPRHIAEALRDGRNVDPEHRDSVTIFFSDIVGFTRISSTMHPRKIANMLDRLYSKFDKLSQKHDIFKVETVGDAYMAVTNLVKDQPDDHAKRIAEFAIDAVVAANETIIDPDKPEKGYVNIRVGFHSGSVVADVVGTRNPRYCLFGDTVNTASRMESNSTANRIHCSKSAAKLLCKQFPELRLKSRGKIPIKGKGKMHTYWVDENATGRRSANELSAIDFSDSNRNPSYEYSVTGSRSSDPDLNGDTVTDVETHETPVLDVEKESSPKKGPFDFLSQNLLLESCEDKLFEDSCDLESGHESSSSDRSLFFVKSQEPDVQENTVETGPQLNGQNIDHIPNVYEKKSREKLLEEKVDVELAKERNPSDTKSLELKAGTMVTHACVESQEIDNEC